MDVARFVHKLMVTTFIWLDLGAHVLAVTKNTTLIFNDWVNVASCHHCGEKVYIRLDCPPGSRLNCPQILVVHPVTLRVIVMMAHDRLVVLVNLIGHLMIKRVVQKCERSCVMKGSRPSLLQRIRRHQIRSWTSMAASTAAIMLWYFPQRMKATTTKQVWRICSMTTKSMLPSKIKYMIRWER